MKYAYLYLGRPKLVCEVAFCVGFIVKMSQISYFLAQIWQHCSAKAIFKHWLGAPGLGHALVTRRDAPPPAYPP